MRAYVDAKAFSEALSNVCRVLQKSNIPVWEDVPVRFTDGFCTLTSTDFTTWLSVKIPARGDTFPFVLRKPAMVEKACHYFKGEVAVELHETTSENPKVIFSCGQRSGEFDTYPERCDPRLPEKKETVSFTANAAALLKRVERVKYAVREPKGFSERAERTCVQFNGNNVFCLDGYRAACDTDTSLTFPKQFLTWGKSLAYLKLMGDSEVLVEVDERNIWFSTDSVTICCKREGVETFDLACAVPEIFQEEFYVNPSEFLRELEYLKGFVQKYRTGCVRFCGGRMFLDDVPNRCETKIQIDGHSELTVGFSLRFMEDALKQFKGESSVKMKLSSVIGPIILEAEGRNDFAMVLPARPCDAAAA